MIKKISFKFTIPEIVNFLKRADLKLYYRVTATLTSFISSRVMVGFLGIFIFLPDNSHDVNMIHRAVLAEEDTLAA